MKFSSVLLFSPYGQLGCEGDKCLIESFVEDIKIIFRHFRNFEVIKVGSSEN